MTPAERIIQFWMARTGAKQQPKSERDALLLHDSIKATGACWDCPKRLQCEWAEKNLRFIIQNKKLLREEIRKEKGEASRQAELLIAPAPILRLPVPSDPSVTIASKIAEAMQTVRTSEAKREIKEAQKDQKKTI